MLAIGGLRAPRLAGLKKPEGKINEPSTNPG